MGWINSVHPTESHLPEVVMTTLVTTKSTDRKFPLMAIRYFASNVFVYTKTRNSGSRLRQKSLFLLVGKHPKPFEQTAPLVWLRGILPLSGYRPMLIFRSRLCSGDCGFSEGTGASPSKVSLSGFPACFRNL